MTDTSTQQGTGVAGAADHALRTTGVCTTCGKEIEAPWAVRTGNGRLLRFCGPACAYPDPRNVLARHMLAWLRHLSHSTELPDEAVVLAVASPDPAEASRITAGMIRDAAGQ